MLEPKTEPVATLKPANPVEAAVSQFELERLIRGEILLTAKPYSAWGGAVTAQMYLPVERHHVWQQVTDYPRWVEFFPDIVCSEVVGDAIASRRGGKRLYQAARKAFLIFTAEVEIHLRVFEIEHDHTTQQIQFCLEKGSFTDFFANLKLRDTDAGTLLTYSVQATPAIPVPSVFIQQAIRLDLPANMQKMRQVICDRPLC